MIAFHDYVVIEREKSSDRKTGGGLIVKDSRSPDVAVVKSLGFGISPVMIDNMGIDIGTRVVVSQLSGTDVYIDGEMITFVRVEDIIGKVDDDKSLQE